MSIRKKKACPKLSYQSNYLFEKIKFRKFHVLVLLKDGIKFKAQCFIMLFYVMGKGGD